MNKQQYAELEAIEQHSLIAKQLANELHSLKRLNDELAVALRVIAVAPNCLNHALMIEKARELANQTANAFDTCVILCDIHQDLH